LCGSLLLLGLSGNFVRDPSLIQHRVDYPIGNTLVLKIHNVIWAQTVDRSRILDVGRNDIVTHLCA
jgi:hypothetical protein